MICEIAAPANHSVQGPVSHQGHSTSRNQSPRSQHIPQSHRPTANMSSSRPDDGASSPSSSPLASPRDLPRLDVPSQQRPKPRPKLVSFGRDTSGGGRPTTEGRPKVNFIDEVDEHEPEPYENMGRMSREMDPLLKESMSPLDDDDWQGEQQTEETKSSWFLFLLTFGGLGLQIGWSVETSNGSVGTFRCFYCSQSFGPCICFFLHSNYMIPY